MPILIPTAGEIQRMTNREALDETEAALIEIGHTITFDMRNILAYAERALTAIHSLKEKNND